MRQSHRPAAETTDKALGGNGAGYITPAALSEGELNRARVAYRGSLEMTRAWRSFTSNTRHHDTTYWCLLTALFADPGVNRMTLIDRIMECAGVSRSTAERAIREARASGYIVDQPTGKEVRYYLSDRMFDHFIRFFRDHMDLEKIIVNLGYAKQ